jgi:hypothetical protein
VKKAVPELSVCYPLGMLVTTNIFFSHFVCRMTKRTKMFPNPNKEREQKKLLQNHRYVPVGGVVDMHGATSISFLRFHAET